MATKEKEILDKVLTEPTQSELIGRMVEGQDETFPKPSDIVLEDAYVDSFSVPKWCNEKDYAFAWMNPRDDIERHRVLEVGYFKIVNRISPCILGKPNERDFRDHGAVERQGMILVYRPKDLDDKMRTKSVLAHRDMVSASQSPKSTDHYEITSSKGKEAESSKIDVQVYEEAGEPVADAKDMKHT